MPQYGMAGRWAGRQGEQGWLTSRKQGKTQHLHLRIMPRNKMCEVCAAHFYPVVTKLEKDKQPCRFRQQLSYHRDCLHLWVWHKRKPSSQRPNLSTLRYVTWAEKRPYYNYLSTNHGRFSLSYLAIYKDLMHETTYPSYCAHI